MQDLVNAMVQRPMTFCVHLCKSGDTTPPDPLTSNQLITFPIGLVGYKPIMVSLTGTSDGSKAALAFWITLPVKIRPTKSITMPYSMIHHALFFTTNIGFFFGR